MNKRMSQLVTMFSEITGVTQDEALTIIKKTETGRLVDLNNQAVLYEQQTENLYAIASDLKKIDTYVALAESITIKKIIHAMNNLSKKEKETEIQIFEEVQNTQSVQEMKNRNTSKLLNKRKNMLQIQKQNKINARRVEQC